MPSHRLVAAALSCKGHGRLRQGGEPRSELPIKTAVMEEVRANGKGLVWLLIVEVMEPFAVEIVLLESQPALV